MERLSHGELRVVYDTLAAGHREQARTVGRLAVTIGGSPLCAAAEVLMSLAEAYQKLSDHHSSIASELRQSRRSDDDTQPGCKTYEERARKASVGAIPPPLPATRRPRRTVSVFPPIKKAEE